MKDVVIFLAFGLASDDYKIKKSLFMNKNLNAFRHGIMAFIQFFYTVTLYSTVLKRT